MSQWNCSRSKACVCQAVCGRALSINRTIPRERLTLRRSCIARRRCSNGIAHAARLVYVRQYADVHCRATEQFHARACLFAKITKVLIGLQKMNNTSLLAVGGILNRHSHDHSYLCTYRVTRSDVQLYEATFQHHTEHQKPKIGCNKIGARTVCENVLYFPDGLRNL